MNLIEPLLIASPGWFSILINAAVKGFLILLAAAILAQCIRKASAAWRHLIWALALTAAGLVPVLSYGLPSINLPLLSESPTVGPAALAPVTPIESTRTVTAPADSTKRPPIPTSERTGSLHSPVVQQQDRPFTWHQWLLAIWLAGFALFLLPPLTGLLSLTIFRRQCSPLRDAAIDLLVSRLSKRLNLTRPVSIVRSRTRGSRAVPSVWGVSRPVLFWPASSQRWDQGQIESVLLHELAHIKRKDWMTQIVCTLFCALHWFNPLAWLAVHRIRLESEKACDDLVLGAGVKNPAYAQHLLNVARNLVQPQHWGPMTLAMARSSQIEDRLRDILDPDKSHRELTRWTLVLGVTIAAIITVPLATMRAIAKPDADVSSTQALPQISGRITMGIDGEAGSEVLLRITLFEKGSTGSRPPASRVLTARCDANGRFVADLPEDLQVDMLLLESLLPGHCIWREDTSSPYYVGVDETLYGDQGELAEEIRLMPSDYLTGRVVDEEGNGLPGVAIGAHLRDDALVGYTVQTLQTDEDGRFEIYRIPLDHSAYTLGYVSFKRDGMVPTKIDGIFTLANDRKRDLEVVMSRGYSVSGSLTDVDGNAAADALIEVTLLGKDTPTGRLKNWTYRKAAKTNSRGAFVITGIIEGEHEIQAINVSSLQKVVIQRTIDRDMSDLSLQLSPMILPAETRPIDVLGMKVINTNDVIRDVFGLELVQHGVLILDPGGEYKRFQIGELQPGNYFVSVGNESVRSVIDFISMLLENVSEEHGTDLSTLPSMFRSNTRVVFGFRRASGVGLSTQYMKLNKTDVMALQEQYSQLPKARHADIYPDYHVERNMVGVMLMSVKAARFSYSRENDKQLPKSLEDLRPYLLDEQNMWRNAEDARLRREYRRYHFYQWLRDNAVLYFAEPKESEPRSEGSILGYCHSMLKRHGKTCVIYDTRALDYEIVSQEELEKQLQEHVLLRQAL